VASEGGVSNTTEKIKKIPGLKKHHAPLKEPDRACLSP
jgi:hypothetical protein